MPTFIGRRKELDTLEASYGKPGAFLLYGRRRAGKTFLIRKFCENKRHLYIDCVDSSSEDNLCIFSDALKEATGSDKEYRNFLEVFRDLADICASEGLVLAIDEFQYLTDASPEVVSYTQHLIDDLMYRGASTVILCGSSVRLMRSFGEDGANPLFGRFKRIIRLGPMPFTDIVSFHPDMSEYDCMKLYLTIGGIPRYHSEIEESTYERCIENHFLSEGWMTEETENLVRSEFSPATRYLATLSSISNGSVILKEISEKVGVEESTCKVYLSELVKSGLVGIVHPMMGAPKRSRYYVSDSLFAFNYEVLTKRRSLMAHKDKGTAYRALLPHIETFLGKRFELFCMEYIERNYPVTEIGRWWIDNPSKGVHEDIDIVARTIDEGIKTDLYIECKFTRSKAGFHVFNTLESRVMNYMPDTNRCLGIISISGFEEELVEFAEQTGLLLIGPDELYGHKKAPGIKRPGVS